MNAPYPGRDTLRDPKINNSFTATCLKCGYVAQDPYNWVR
jgi:hypothetical protein